MSELLSEIFGSQGAPVVVLFGGSPDRRDEVIRLLSVLGDITIHGTLSEAEGMQKLAELRPKVDLVLIGGRYTEEQRVRISAWVAEHLPVAQLTQPGFEYPYENGGIQQDVRIKLDRVKRED